MNLRPILPVLLSLTGALGVSVFQGCSSMELDNSGEMVAVYRFGQFQMLLNANGKSSAEAVQKTLPEFDLYQISSQVGSHQAVITARNRADQIVRIELQESNALQTLINIQWGAGGDKALSRRFFDAVDRKLTR